MKLREPKYCSSFHCSGPPNSYCIDCSHAGFVGKAKVEEENWGWEHNPWYGPEFKVNGAEVFPMEDHPVWDSFESWWTKLQKHYKKFGEE